MSGAVLPIKDLASRLERCDDSEFITLLGCLRSPRYVDERLAKSDLSLLATKTLALLRSSQDSVVWRGCHTSVVICSYNPLVLCGHGGQLLAAIYSKLEHKVEYYSSTVQTPQSKVVLQALVYSLGSLINLMRGKPALSRESLVPQLKVIIPLLVKLARLEPKLALPVLKTLLYKNTTTFRPFANKFRVVLSELLIKEYEVCDKETQRLICDNFAYLHLIKLAPSNGGDETQAHHKTHQDDTWKMGIFSVLAKFKPILDLCGEFLDLEQDKEVQKLIQALNVTEEDSNVGDFLPGLKLDMNSPLTLWEAPRRLSLLLDLLSSFMTLPTPYPVRVPLGFCISVAEGLLSMTSNYLPLKRDVRRDSELTSVIQDILPQIQFVGVRLLSVISQTYGKLCLSLLPSILSSLELFIPLQPKSSRIDLQKCISLKYEFMTVFSLISSLSSHMGHQLNEVELIKKLVEVSLHLTEDHSALEFSNSRDIKTVRSKDVKQKQKKDHSSASISDLYLQPDSFKFKCSERCLFEINRFLEVIVSNWKLPTNEHLKILKYTISTALKWEEQRGYVPESYVKLLRAEVLHPGAERVSILPIAVSLLNNTKDDVFDLLCHPRLPMSLVHNVKPTIPVTEEPTEDIYEHTTTEIEEDQPPRPVPTAVDIDRNVEEVNLPGDEKQEPSKHSKTIFNETVVENLSSSDVPTVSTVEEVSSTTNVKKRELDVEAASSIIQKRTKVGADETTTSSVISEVTVEISGEKHQTAIDSMRVQESTISEDNPAPEEDSDFEMPTINVSDDEDGNEESDEEDA
ncbi:hypothetical protein HG537_0C06280 [Torulaspora globosa]|uniref:Pre-rRNA-processing protein RIX1 n=1 Tax=Torulaspora globosa TaxID=48254 RepID=A0A7H9HRP1_9SACH|nr:hypothetical protein HG537_0C06280 [Torulaspora sp. CBS 2947]